MLVEASSGSSSGERMPTEGDVSIGLSPFRRRPFTRFRCSHGNSRVIAGDLVVWVHRSPTSPVLRRCHLDGRFDRHIDFDAVRSLFRQGGVIVSSCTQR